MDDERDMALLFEGELEHEGFSVNVFNNPAEALKDFKSNIYDLVMLDIIMPETDGFDLYKELKKLDPDVKICFFTASKRYREEFRKGEFQTLSKDLFIPRPISIKDLVKEIRNRIGSTK